MKRRRTFGRSIVFNALGILAILVLLAAGMCAGMSRKLAARGQARAENRNPVRA